jgi:hypothetical protein
MKTQTAICMKHFVLVLLFLIAEGSAFGLATFTTGDELRENCRYALSDSDAEKATPQGGLCIGFIDGFRQFEVILAAALQSAPNARVMCIPDGVSNRQAIKVVVRYLDQHPESLHKYAGALVFEALSEAFPCLPPPAAPSPKPQ